MKNTKESKISYKLLWELKNPHQCMRCNSEKFYSIKNRPEIKECQICKTQLSIKTNSYLQNTKIPIDFFTKAIHLYHVNYGCISVSDVQKILKINSRSTCNNLLKIIHNSISDRISDSSICGEHILSIINFAEKDSYRSLKNKKLFRLVSSDQNEKLNMARTLLLTPAELISFLKIRVQPGAEIKISPNDYKMLTNLTAEIPSTLLSLANIDGQLDTLEFNLEDFLDQHLKYKLANIYFFDLCILNSFLNGSKIQTLANKCGIEESLLATFSLIVNRDYPDLLT